MYGLQWAIMEGVRVPGGAAAQAEVRKDRGSERNVAAKMGNFIRHKWQGRAF